MTGNSLAKQCGQIHSLNHPFILHQLNKKYSWSIHLLKHYAAGLACDYKKKKLKYPGAIAMII
jgi:hypothetical protein